MADSLEGFAGTNSGMGQGLAYVLPQSRTTGYFMQLANERAQERRQQALYQQKQQQQANDEYAKQLYNWSTPKVAAEFSKYIQPKFNALLQKGVDYHTKTGQSPFENPEFIKERTDLQAEAANTDELQKRATALGIAIADKSQHYTPESQRQVADALAEYHSNPVAYLTKPFPSLQARDLGMADFHKLAGQGEYTLETVGGYDVKRPNTAQNAAKARFTLSQPEAEPMLQKKYGVNTVVGDVFAVPDANGKISHPTDVPSINSIADHFIQNAAQPHFAETLKEANIDINDPHAKNKLVELIQKNNSGYSRAYNELTGIFDSDISPEKKRNTTEERLALSERNAERADRRLALAEEREASKATKAVDPTYFQDLSERMRTGVAGSGEEFNNYVANNPDYLHGLKINTNNPEKVVIEVPAKYKDKPNEETGKIDRVKIKDGYRVTLDSTDPNQWHSGFATLYKDITGDGTATPSKAMTLSGKGKVAGGLQNPNQGNRKTLSKKQDPLGLF